MDPLSLATILGAGSSLIQGLIGAFSSNNAANTQTDAINRAITLQQQAVAQARKDAAPWLNAGKAALAKYSGELGLTPGYKSTFRATPGYQFDIAEGTKGVVNSLASLGMKNSGAALKRLTDYRLGKADQFHENFLTRLSNLATGGQQQVQNTNTDSINGASGIGGLGIDAGTTRASGFVGVGNALSGAIGGIGDTIGNYLGRRSAANTGWSFA